MSVARPIFPENPNQIDRPSSALLQFAIETFPSELAYCNVELAILDESGDEARPRITQRLEYAGKGVYKEVGFRSEEEKKTAPNHVEVLLNGDMNDFKASFLPGLIEQGFKVIGADLAITMFHRRDDGGSGTLGGDYMSTGVVMSRWSIWIQEGNCTSEQKQQLTDWFEKVKAEKAKN